MESRRSEILRAKLFLSEFPGSLTHSSAQSEDGVGHVGHVLLLEEVVGLEDVDLLHSVLHQSFLEAGRSRRDN